MPQLAELAPRRTRVRVGIGAAVVLFLIAAAAAVLFSALTPTGFNSEVINEFGGGVDPDTGNVISNGPDASSGSNNVTTIFVHILGAVEVPGLYELRDGARAVDAVAAAGGFDEKADHTQLNLARFVTDGEQIVVPEIGQVPISGAAMGGVGAVVPGKVNINTADAATLETLPRIGPSMSSRIISWRESNGRFTTIDDLMSVTGIGDKTFEGLRDLVTV
ncbi:MAG: ComEA family DNA-binding protein [Microbacteriaceae bacterium]